MQIPEPPKTEKPHILVCQDGKMGWFPIDGTTITIGKDTIPHDDWKFLVFRTEV